MDDSENDASPETPDLTEFESYVDSGEHVIRDRENPDAWVRSADAVSVED